MRIRLLLLCMLFFHLTLYASFSDGVSWIEGKVGGPDFSTDLARTEQSASEMYKLLKKSDSAVSLDALEELVAHDMNSTEMLVRKIEMRQLQDRDGEAYLSLLLTHQNEGGGFGAYAGYNPTLLDSAFALNGLGLHQLQGEQASALLYYLSSTQKSDGSWGEGANESSIYITAKILEGLAYYQTIYNVGDMVTRAQSYLVAQKKSDGSVGETFETAVSAKAFYRSFADMATVEPLLDYLRRTQSVDGGWDDDTYVTALALTALLSAEEPRVNPNLAGIEGVLVDAQSGVALSGVKVTLGGLSTFSDVGGRFVLNDVEPAAYEIEFTKSGYATMSGSVLLSGGKTTNLGRLLMSEAVGALTGSIRGTVTEGSTGKALSGVTVIAGSKSAVSDADGAYLITGLEPSTVMLSVIHDGYYGVTAQVEVKAGTTVLFSPALVAESSVGSLPASVQGKVVDDETRLALSGATLSFSGVGDYSLETGTDGTFNGVDMTAGTYAVRVEKPGYLTIQSVATLRSGVISNFGTLTMQRSDAAVTTVTIAGTVTDTFGNVIAGASVQAGAMSATTDVAGAYRIEGISAGAIDIIVNAEGFYAAAASVTADAGQTVVFSPSMRSVPDAGISGVILDANSSLPVEGAVITLSGSDNQSVTTAADGSYEIKPLNIGALTISVAKEGYDPVTASFTVQAGTNADFSPKLYPEDSSPADANKAGIQGIMMDSSTNMPLADAYIEISGLSGTRAVYSDGDGAFAFTGISDQNVTISFTHDGYQAISYLMPLKPLQTFDLGQVRLRPVQVEQLLGDLTVITLKKAYTTNPSTLEINGSVQIDFANIGTAPVDKDVSVMAFYDANQNGAFEPHTDMVLGTNIHYGGVPVDSNRTLVLDLYGKLPYRDAPVSVWLDDQMEILELVEINNIVSTSKYLLASIDNLGEFSPTIKWEWKSPTEYPVKRHVMSAPVVAPLIDTNNDGQIDEKDVPAVIANTYGGGYADGGILRALDGRDGKEIWNTGSNRSAPVSNIAVGDIDQDGFVEIVALRLGTGVMAFEHDGTLKWQNSEPIEGTLNYDSWGAIALSDLEGDGTVEIVAGRLVLNADGSRKWLGDHYDGGPYGGIPIVADIDLDGKQEVLAGGYVYDSEGNVVWRHSSADGFAGVGNFNDDDYPEIVVVKNGYLYLLDHEGVFIWYTAIPDGGYGGPPTIADFDNDGEVEIGVASRIYYAVFDTDGSLMWTQYVDDASSSTTGSSVFDFDSDGRSEVVYADQDYLRVYDGETGKVIFKVLNSSSTTHELPVIADIDNDDHADIVIAENGYLNGIRVFQDANNTWANVRKIWNQHSYHITNVNDDGTIPAHEKPSWLTHNTYRLNTFLDRDPLAVPDYTVSLLRLIDNGESQPYSLKARVGNAGTVAASQPVAVSFFDGDPLLGGTLLGAVDVPDLGGDSYVDVTLPNVAALSGSDLVAVVDYADVVTEYDETNNRMQIPAMAYNTLGALSVSTDAEEYYAGSVAQLQSLATNTGAMDAALSVELSVRDGNGKVAAAYGVMEMGVLASGESAEGFQLFNAGEVLAGAYTLDGILRDASGNVLATATTPFVVVAGNGDGAANAGLRITTDRTLYHTTDTMQITNLVRNLTTNYVLPESLLRVTVTDTAAQAHYDTTVALGELTPQGMRELASAFGFSGLAEGNYTVRGTLMIDSDIQAQDSVRVQVASDVAQALIGEVSVDAVSVEAGTPVTCRDYLENRAVSDLDNQEIRRLLVSFDTEAVLSETMQSIDLAVDANMTLERTVPTIGFESGSYGCILQARVGDAWKALDHAVFNVVAPPIAMDYNLTMGSKGRLLVLLDAPDAKCGDCGCGKGRERQKHTADPYGPSDAADLEVQRAYLEAFLTQEGYAYMIVESAEAFERAFRSGDYNGYLLFQEEIKLSEQLQDELTEAVYRGEGLLVSGKHDQRNGRLDTALGIKTRDKTNHAATLAMIDEEPYTLLGMALNQTDDKYMVELAGADLLGRFETTAAGDHHNALRRGHTCGSRTSRGEGAVTYHRYYRGEAVFVGFDLLLYAAAEGNGSIPERLLGTLLETLQPETFSTYVSDLLPLRLNLVNRGVATPGTTVTQSFNTDATFVENGEAALDDEGRLVWNYMLEEANATALDFWMRLPTGPVQLQLQTEIYTGTPETPVFYGAFTETFDVTGVKPVESLLDDAGLLRDHKARSVTSMLRKAQWSYGRADYGKALMYALKAAQLLDGIPEDAARALRYDLAVWIKSIARSYNAQLLSKTLDTHGARK